MRANLLLRYSALQQNSNSMFQFSRSSVHHFSSPELWLTMMSLKCLHLVSTHSSVSLPLTNGPWEQISFRENAHMTGNPISRWLWPSPPPCSILDSDGRRGRTVVQQMFAGPTDRDGWSGNYYAAKWAHLWTVCKILQWTVQSEFGVFPLTMRHANTHVVNWMHHRLHSIVDRSARLVARFFFWGDPT